MSTVPEHLANIEHEINEMNVHGHLTEFDLSVFVGGIESEIHLIRQRLENGRRHNRDGDSSSPGG